MKEQVFCYVWASGQIEFGESVPNGALSIAKGEREALENAISAIGRLAHDNKTWLVPGIPEAETSNDGIDALIHFRGELVKRLDG